LEKKVFPQNRRADKEASPIMKKKIAALFGLMPDSAHRLASAFHIACINGLLFVQWQRLSDASKRGKTPQ